MHKLTQGKFVNRQVNFYLPLVFSKRRILCFLQILSQTTAREPLEGIMELRFVTSSWFRLLSAFIVVLSVIFSLFLVNYAKTSEPITNDKVELELTTVLNFERHVQDFTYGLNEIRFFPLVKAVVNGKTYVLVRDGKSQSLALLQLPLKSVAIQLPKEFINSYPVNVSPNQNGFMVLAYNPKGKNVSGQSINKVVEWLDLWNFDLIKKSYEKVARIEGGLTSEVRSLQTPNGTYFCLALTCHNYKDGKVNSIALFNMQPVELAFDRGTNRVVLLGRSINDDRFEQEGFSYYQCDLQEVGPKCEQIVKKGVPYFEVVNKQSNRVSIKYAKTPNERLEIVLRDLEYQLLTFIGSHNTEGRIAWQATYAVEGLKALRSLENLDPKVRGQIDFFSRSYLSWLAGEILNDDAVVSSRRYSLNRTSLISKLHTTRIASLLNLDTSNSSLIGTAKYRLINLLKNDVLTLEIIDQETRNFLRFKRGTDFWADGVKVPWNYQSSIIEFAMINKADSCGFNILGNKVLNNFLEDFSNSEFTKAKKNSIWNYSLGPLHYGWTSDLGISTNTNSYSGDLYIATPEAHSSYRNMDARAITLATRCGYKDNKGWKSIFEIALIKGLLEPSFLAATEIDFQYQLNQKQRDYWGRLTDVWQISNSVWTVIESREQLSFDLLDNKKDKTKR